jgi:hypothetical protein
MCSIVSLLTAWQRFFNAADFRAEFLRIVADGNQIFHGNQIINMALFMSVYYGSAILLTWIWAWILTVATSTASSQCRINSSAAKDLAIWEEKMDLTLDDGLKKLVNRAAKLRLVIRGLLVPLVLYQVLTRAVELLYWQGTAEKIGNVELK